jgi:hypothetical protein
MFSADTAAQWAAWMEPQVRDQAFSDVLSLGTATHQLQKDHEMLSSCSWSCFTL